MATTTFLKRQRVNLSLDARVAEAMHAWCNHGEVPRCVSRLVDRLAREFLADPDRAAELRRCMKRWQQSADPKKPTP